MNETNVLEVQTTLNNNVVMLNISQLQLYLYYNQVIQSLHMYVDTNLQDRLSILYGLCSATRNDFCNNDWSHQM